MKTTLNKIQACGHSKDGFKKLLKHLGKTEADDEPLDILNILDLNDLDDALWFLDTVEGYDREIRLYVVWCSRQVQHLMEDKRAVAALDVSEKFANGDATTKELKAAEDAALEAVIAINSAKTSAVMSISAAALSSKIVVKNVVARVAESASVAAAWAKGGNTLVNMDMDAWSAMRAAQKQELRKILQATGEQA